MVMAVPTRYTAAQVRRFPADGNRYEVVEGTLLVTPAPSPRHQYALASLYDLLQEYLKQTGAGRVLWSPADIELSPDTLVQPDLFVLPPGPPPRHWSEVTLLLLAIEVLSPATARHDRLVKRRLFQERGIEYWIVDLDARVVERWPAGESRPEILAEEVVWRPGGTGEPLVVDLVAFFSRLET